MLTLYGAPRSRAARCLWMLEELGVPYENDPVGFTGASRTPEFLKLNPNGHIPVLRDGDLVLFESLAINLYLARKYGAETGLWPTTVEDEGRVYQWSVWAMTEAEGPLVTVLVHRRVLPEAQRDPKKIEEGVQQWPKPLAVLDGMLAGREYLLGDRFTVADLNVASVVLWAPLAGLDMASAPHAQAWLARCTARPALQRAQKKK